MYTKDIMKRIMGTIQELNALYGELSEELPALYDANELPTLAFPATIKKKPSPLRVRRVTTIGISL